MNFFEHQDRARQQTGVLVFYFAIALALIVAAVDGTVAAILTSYGTEIYPKGVPKDIYLWTTAMTAAVIVLGTLMGIAGMSGGGAAVARKLGATQILPNTTNPDERRLMNVMEEMAIASGITVPAVFVFEGAEINAFAAGDQPDSAVIAVSRGALSKLNREELQGVVAHEFSHVFNGDMRFNLRLIGILNGILMIAVVGRILLRTRGKKNPLPLLGLALLLIGYAGVFMSRLIKSAISRQREFLADASAVQFTRNPDGLLGALAKISRGSSFVNHPQAEELSHLFFAKGFQSAFDSLFATHPPLIDRLRAINPSFRLETYREKEVSAKEKEKPATVKDDRVSSFAPSKATPVEPAAIVASIASPTAGDLESAATFRASIPDDIAAKLASPTEAAGVVFALLLSEKEEIRHRQLQMAGTGGVDAIYESLQHANLRLRLPYLELALPCLRMLPLPEQQAFLSRVRQIIRADNRITPFEFAAEILLSKNLQPHEGKKAASDTLADSMCVLSFLAYAGAAGQESSAAISFRKGFAELEKLAPKAILPWDYCGTDATREALWRLTSAQPLQKQKIVAALAACVLADAVIKTEEWDVLRAFCQCLGCPTPLLHPNK